MQLCIHKKQIIHVGSVKKNKIVVELPITCSLLMNIKKRKM